MKKKRSSSDGNKKNKSAFPSGKGAQFKAGVILPPFTVAGEASEGCGEDCFAGRLDSNRALIAVFDGCGGLGSRRYLSENDKTGAYIAARLSATVITGLFDVSDDGDPSDALFDALNAENTRLNSVNTPLNIRSDMLCPLPTTVCAAYIGNDECRVYWIGDSRLFALDCDGLHALTDDDGDFKVKETYFFERRLTGYANAACRFELHSRTFKPSKPCLLFAATDGMYRAFLSPMETEEAILTALVGTETPEAFRDRLHEIIDECADDDFTAVFAVIGIDDFPTLTRELTARAEKIKRLNAPLAKAAPHIHDTDIDKPRAAIWKSYRDSYYRYYSGD